MIGNTNNNHEFSRVISSELLAAKRLINVFSGKPEESFSDWLFSIERYFLKANTSDKRKADFAIDYLSGSARRIFQSVPDCLNASWGTHVSNLRTLHKFLDPDL